ncbi:MAG: OsmC family protein [Candidatus Helarchaeota archaeon]|nr:OsmC family protein [Candidatus Helarchaeota archaeon]
MKALIDEMKKNPGLAKQTMKVKLIKSGPLKVDVKVGKHKLIFDEDKALGGTGEGPAPSSMLLAAIGGCMLNTMQAWSQLLKIKINGADISVKGTLDAQGFLGIDDKIPAGFQTIDIDIAIDSEEPPEKITKLVEAVEKHCPVYNTVLKSAKMKVALKSAAPKSEA